MTQQITPNVIQVMVRIQKYFGQLKKDGPYSWKILDQGVEHDLYLYPTYAEKLKLKDPENLFTIGNEYLIPIISHGAGWILYDIENLGIKNLDNLEEKAIKKPPKEVNQIQTKTDEKAQNEIVDEAQSNTSIIPIQHHNEVFSISEKKDELQIADEMLGAIIKEYFYQFKNKTTGRITTGISYAGMKAIVSKMGNVHILDLELVEDKDRNLWRCKVKVRNIAKNLDGMGIASQKIESYNAEFADRIAFSKALRNAWRSIIDEALIIKMGEEWLDKNRGK